MILINDVECHTQREVVLEHLKTGQQICQDDAYKLCGSQRLAVIIYNLRKEGYDICNMNQKGKNRFGNNTNFVKYKLNG
jgi:hypothetical protein|tara:strand:+ start:2260 stop:2496 length:237 start_codon:yes stop_codon:yes gene_type:complete